MPWLIGGGIVLVALSRTRRLINTITAQVTGIDIDGRAANVFTAPFLVKVQISNGSLMGATIRSITGDLIYNGAVIGRLNSLNQFQVKPTSAVNITIPVQISTISAAIKLKDLLLSGLKPTNVIVDATVVSNTGNFPLKTQVL